MAEIKQFLKNSMNKTLLKDRETNVTTWIQHSPIHWLHIQGHNYISQQVQDWRCTPQSKLQWMLNIHILQCNINHLHCILHFEINHKRFQTTMYITVLTFVYTVLCYTAKAFILAAPKILLAHSYTIHFVHTICYYA